MEKNKIFCLDFLTGNRQEITIKTGIGGHSGSGDAFMRGFLRTAQTNSVFTLSGAARSVESHSIALAAEESGRTGRTVRMNEMWKKMESLEEA